MKVISTKVIALFFCIFSLDVSASEEDIYFLSAYPVYEYYETYPTILYRYSISSNKLSRVKAITTEKQGAAFIRVYREEGIVLVGNRSSRDYFQVDILDINNISDTKTVEFELCRGCVFLGSGIYLQKNKNDVVELVANFGKIVGDDFIEEVDGFRILRNDKGLMSDIEPFYPNELNLENVVNSGWSGGVVEGGDDLASIFSKNGKPIYRADKKVPLGWDFPENLKVREKEQVSQMINSERYKVVAKKYWNSGPVTYHVFSKRYKKWMSLTLSGDGHWVKVFDDWFVAEQSYRGFSNKNDLKKERENFSVLLKKNKIDTLPEYPSLLERSRRFNIRKTNLIHVFNIDADTGFELVTDSDDSEVLLIAKDSLYYRDGNRLMRMDMSDGKMGVKKVLLTDHRLEGVHWAFGSDKEGVLK